MRVLVTGHTGFKGSWLSLILARAGYEVYGISLEPRLNDLYELAGVQQVMSGDFRQDIQDIDALTELVKSIRPAAAIHLAAQPIVLESYRNPYETFTTNVLGTLNFLQSLREVDSLKSIVIATTDKVYLNNENKRAFAEADPLGAADPYATSKAMADLLTQSWKPSSVETSVGIVRAGNVIGGGDMSPERLIPDLFTAISMKKIPVLRNPNAVRPWQHVLDCVRGYVLAMEYLNRNSGRRQIWNFGPNPAEYRTVEEVTKLFLQEFGLTNWDVIPTSSHKEAHFLTLDPTLAKSQLAWNDRLSLPKSIKWTANWYKAKLEGNDLSQFTIKQLEEYEALS